MKKIGSQIGAVFLLLSIVSVTSFFMVDNFTKGTATDSKVINIAGRERMLSQKMSKEVMEYHLVPTAEAKSSLQGTHDEFEAALNGLINGSEELGLPKTTNSEIVTQLQKVSDIWQPFSANVMVVLEQRAGTDKAIEYIKNNNVTLLKEMNKAVVMYEQLSKSKIDSLRMQILLSNLIIIIVSVIGWYFLSNRISKPIQHVVDVANKITNGDLTVEKIKTSRKDEIGVLIFTVNMMVEKLKDIIGKVQSTSQQLAASAEEISAGTEEVASGTTHQAEASTSITQMVNEMVSAVQVVTQNAEQASSFSEDTVSMATSGGIVIQNTVTGMGKINDRIHELVEKSAQIGEIIEVIDDIAEQTNLLALNAAIEAARAGEAGKGFAVVADEVRKLAERSSVATKEISSLIQGIQDNTNMSVEAVKEGNQMVNQAGESFDEILKVVKESAVRVAEIAAASEQFSAQTDEILQSVEGIAALAEETSASTEETAASANDLAQMAEGLQTLTNEFKV